MPRLSKIGAAALAAFGWTGGASVSASYLVVAGGAGSGSPGVRTGGGGAGGYRTGSLSLNPTQSYTVTVGAGGSAGAAGSNSVFSTITSTGGGNGGTFNNVAGATGGSGGGGGGGSTGAAGGAGTVGQGSAGGTGSTSGSSGAGGGGGGASAVGGNASGDTGGTGGAGTASSISGSSVTYAGGGGGGAVTTAGSGGAGGGGAGSTSGTATAGTANLGGGGGGTGTGTNAGGGSGIVIISYTAPQKFGGGVVTTSGANVIHTFNTSGTLSPLSSLTASYLIVAGGGAGGRSNAGGGGAGGLLTGSGLTIDTNSNYVVVVGAGGTAAAGTGANGSNSSFSMVTTTAVGGGGGGNIATNGNSGGSGGGGGNDGTTVGTGGAGTSGQGNAGGTPTAQGAGPGGGGGGAGAAGAANVSSQGGAGGNGTASSITGSSVTYAGGGGGGSNVGTGGVGGTGGGGTGAFSSTNATAGTANLGGGGGGGGNPAINASGGSGVVIISYAGATQQMAGGTVTITGGNVIHTFTSSGYLTPIKLVNNSLRFRNSASAYLSRTPTTAGNLQKWTWSGWVKRGKLGSPQQTLFSAQSTTTANLIYCYFATTDALTFYQYSASGATTDAFLGTTQVFRDPAAWYHIVVAVDTTQATAANRTILYVNGVQVTSFTATTYFTQNTNTYINSTNPQNIARNPDNSSYFDGYQTEINFVDGQQLTPTSFGTTNSYGVWQPITYGGSYGTNGFYLPFTNTTSPTTLAYDFSPNGNNWTPNNISVTAGATYDSMKDVPTLTSATAANYVVLNPLSSGTSTYRMVLTNGNLTATSPVGNYQLRTNPTMFSSSGKFYCEVVFTAGYSAADGTLTTGFISASAGDRSTNNNSLGYENTGAIGYLNNGSIYVNGSVYTSAGTYATYTINDVIMLAIDMDNQKVYVGKNGTWQNSGNPAAGTGFVYNSGILASGLWGFSASGYGSNPTPNTFVFNFGAGSGFTYTPPSGFVALNTYNL